MFYCTCAATACVKMLGEVCLKVVESSLEPEPAVIRFTLTGGQAMHVIFVAS